MGLTAIIDSIPDKEYQSLKQRAEMDLHDLFVLGGSEISTRVKKTDSNVTDEIVFETGKYIQASKEKIDSTPANLYLELQGDKFTIKTYLPGKDNIQVGCQEILGVEDSIIKILKKADELLVTYPLGSGQILSLIDKSKKRISFVSEYFVKEKKKELEPRLEGKFETEKQFWLDQIEPKEKYTLTHISKRSGLKKGTLNARLISHNSKNPDGQIKIYRDGRNKCLSGQDILAHHLDLFGQLRRGRKVRGDLKDKVTHIRGEDKILVDIIVPINGEEKRYRPTDEISAAEGGKIVRKDRTYLYPLISNGRLKADKSKTPMTILVGDALKVAKEDGIDLSHIKYNKKPVIETRSEKVSEQSKLTTTEKFAKKYDVPIEELIDILDKGQITLESNGKITWFNEEEMKKKLGG